MTAVNAAAAAAAATLDMLVCHGAGIFRYNATIMLSSAPIEIMPSPLIFDALLL